MRLAYNFHPFITRIRFFFRRRQITFMCFRQSGLPYTQHKLRESRTRCSWKRLEQRQANSLRTNGKGMLFPPQSDIFNVEITTAKRVAELVFKRGFAQVKGRPTSGGGLIAWCTSPNTTHHVTESLNGLYQEEEPKGAANPVERAHRWHLPGAHAVKFVRIFERGAGVPIGIGDDLCVGPLADTPRSVQSTWRSLSARGFTKLSANSPSIAEAETEIPRGEDRRSLNGLISFRDAP